MNGKRVEKLSIVKSMEIKLHLAGHDAQIVRALELLAFEWYVAVRIADDLIIGTHGASGRVTQELRFRGFFSK